MPQVIDSRDHSNWTDVRWLDAISINLAPKPLMDFRPPSDTLYTDDDDYDIGRSYSDAKALLWLLGAAAVVVGLVVCAALALWFRWAP